MLVDAPWIAPFHAVVHRHKLPGNSVGTTEQVTPWIDHLLVSALAPLRGAAYKPSLSFKCPLRVVSRHSPRSGAGSIVGRLIVNDQSADAFALVQAMRLDNPQPLVEHCPQQLALDVKLPAPDFA